MENDKKPSTDIMPKGVDPVSFFDKDNDFVLAYKKTEKLASAVYLVTSLFSESEPMKWSLRKKVGDLMSLTLAYKDTPKSGHNDFIYNSKTKVLELISLLEVSFRGGLVSQMNYAILRQEFLNLIDIFTTSNVEPKEMFSHDISKTFFEIQHTETPSKIVAPQEKYQIPAPREDHHKMSYTPVKDKPAQPAEDEKRSNRQNVILGLVKRKGEITIKDVSHIVKDCSEKTIQKRAYLFHK